MGFNINLGAIGVDMVLDTQKWKKGIDDVKADTKKSAGSLKTMLAGAGVAAGAALAAGVVAGAAALVGGLRDATVAAAEFERSIVTAGAKAGATAAELAGLTEVAKTVGLETAFSAQEAAAGLDFLAQAGLNAAEQMKALPGIALLATAGNLELAEAADIATNVLAGFGKGVEDLAEVNDVLAKASISSNTSVTELGQALSFAAPVANGLGVSMQETAAAIGKLGDAGIKGGRAGRGFNAILKNMGKAAKALDVSFTSTDLATKGFTQVLSELEAAGLDGSNAIELFGGIAGPGLLALLAQGTGAIDELTVALDNAGGTAQEISDKQLDTLDGQMTILRGTLETVSIAVGEQLTGAFKPLVKAMIDTATQTGKNDQLLKGLRKTVRSAMLGFADFLEVLAYVGDAATLVKSAFTIIGETIHTMFIFPIKLAWDITKTVVAGIGTAIGGLAVAVLEPLAQMAEALDIGWAGALRTAADGMKNFTGDAFEATMGGISDSVEEVAEKASDIADEMVGAAMGVKRLATGTETAGADMREYVKALRETDEATEEVAKVTEEAAADMVRAGSLVSTKGPFGTETMAQLEGAAAKTKKTAQEVAEIEIDWMQKVANAQTTALEELATEEEKLRARDAAAVAKHYQKALDANGKFNDDKLKAEEELQKERRALMLANNPTSADGVAGVGASINAEVGGGAGLLAEESLKAAVGLGSVASMTTGLVGVFTEMWMSTKGFSEIMGKVNDLIDSTFMPIMEGVMNDLLVILTPVFDILKELQPVIKLVLFAMNPMILPLKLIGKLFKALAKPIDWFITGIKKLVNGIDIFVRNIGRKGKNKAFLDRNGNIVDPKRDAKREAAIPMFIINDSVMSNVQADQAEQDARNEKRAKDHWDELRKSMLPAAEASEEQADGAVELAGANSLLGKDMLSLAVASQNAKAALWSEEQARLKGIVAMEDFAKKMNVSAIVMLGFGVALDRMIGRMNQRGGDNDAVGFGIQDDGTFGRNTAATVGSVIAGSMESATDRLREQFGRAADAADELASSMLNAPEVFNANLARFRAQGAGGTIDMNAQPQQVQQGAGNTFNIENINLTGVSDPDELVEMLEEHAMRTLGSATFMSGPAFNVADVGRI